MTQRWPGAAAVRAGTEPPVTGGVVDQFGRRTSGWYLGQPCRYAIGAFRYPEFSRGWLTRVANIKSQIKRIGTNEKARRRNQAVKSALRTSVRRFRSAAAAGDKPAAEAALTSASRKLDKAASKGIIHKNQAANKKSAMARQAAKL